jgi:hypothetical protein
MALLDLISCVRVASFVIMIPKYLKFSTLSGYFLICHKLYWEWFLLAERSSQLPPPPPPEEFTLQCQFWKYRMFPLSCPRARKLSWNVPCVAGFLCAEVVGIKDTINGTFSIKTL